MLVDLRPNIRGLPTKNDCEWVGPDGFPVGEIGPPLKTPRPLKVIQP